MALFVVTRCYFDDDSFIFKSEFHSSRRRWGNFWAIASQIRCRLLVMEAVSKKRLGFIDEKYSVVQRCLPGAIWWTPEEEKIKRRTLLRTGIAVLRRLSLFDLFTCGEVFVVLVWGHFLFWLIGEKKKVKRRRHQQQNWVFFLWGVRWFW